MLCTAPSVRTAALSCRLQPPLFASSNIHTCSPSSLAEAPHTSPQRTPLSLTNRHVLFNHSQSKAIRHASTTATTTSANPVNPLASTSENLDWNTFFKLRKTRRRYQLGSSIGTSSASFVAATQILINSDMDFIASQVPQIDPMIALGLLTFAAGGAGWLVGPIVGTGVFKMMNGKFNTQMAKKEKEFYHRIKTFRVDPSVSSMANPVPGEL